jgi:hypothetical protein
MNEEQKKFTKFALRIYCSLNGNRAYAATPETADALGALAAAWGPAYCAFDVMDQQDFALFLKQLGAELPGLFQPSPTDPPPLPKLWRDPLTNEPLPNPFKKESRDIKAQTILAKRDPELAAFLKKMATDPFGTLVEIQDAAATAARAKAIKYDHETHKTNPFVTGNVTEQREMAKRDPQLAEVYQREARPLTLTRQLAQKNLTGLGRITRTFPQAAAVVQQAGTIQRAWAVQALKLAKKEIETIASLEQQLQH